MISMDDNVTGLLEKGKPLGPGRIGGYNPQHYAQLDVAEDRHFWFRGRRRVLETLLPQITTGLQPGYRVLEVGCGNGSMLATLHTMCPAGQVIGMDLHLEGLRRARCRSDCPLVQGSLNHPPFGGRFTLIGMFDVLEHILDEQSALRSIYDLLLPDGLFMVMVPAYMSLWSYFDVASDHCRRYSVSYLRGKLSEAGFEIEYLTQFFSILYSLMWLSRRIRGNRQPPIDKGEVAKNEVVSRELHVSSWLNELLAWLLCGEARILARRWTLPLGTSLLALARKRATP
jgi:SAM-dependent methyltransferase